LSLPPSAFCRLPSSFFLLPSSFFLLPVSLRWLTQVFGLDRLVHGIGFGAALGFALPWALGRLGYVIERAPFPCEWQTVKLIVMFPLMGAMMYEVHPRRVMAAVAQLRAELYG
jgi:hypothetical protein